MAVITRWSYKLDGGKAGLHCNYEIYVTTRHHMVIFTVVKERQSPAFWLIWMASGLMRTENFLYKMWIMNNLPTSEPICDLEGRTIVCGGSKDNCQIVWKTLTFETRPSAKPFLWEWVSFTWQKKHDFLISGFTRSLALKQRLGASRKWPTLHINDQCLLFPYLSRFVFAKGKTDAFWLTTKD